MKTQPQLAYWTLKVFNINPEVTVIYCFLQITIKGKNMGKGRKFSCKIILQLLNMTKLNVEMSYFSVSLWHMWVQPRIDLKDRYLAGTVNPFPKCLVHQLMIIYSGHKV